MLNGMIGRRAIAALGAVALGMGAVLALSSTASAEPASFGNIDSAKTGSLTVHKYLYQKEAKTGDISKAPVAGTFADPVAGVVFTVYPLLKGGQAVDLTIPASWDGVEALVPGDNCAAPSGYVRGPGTAMPATGLSGESTTTARLPLGLYQVCETYAPINIVSKAPAFILTVPMPYDKGDKGWVYDVHAYPKNGDTSLTKSIEFQTGLGLGATVRFPVTNVIPDMGPNAWTGYAIQDVLDTRLTPNPTNSGISSVTYGGIDLPAAYYTKAVTGQTVTMKFTADGINWLNTPANAQKGTKIVVTFDTTVKSLGADGIIKNDAQLWTNNPNLEATGNPPVPAEQVLTNWGNLIAKKVANNENGATLAGAVFEVYAAEAPYATDCSASKIVTGDALAVDGKTTFTSVAGLVTIDGLFVSDSVNDSIGSATRCYVLKEITAPAGYVLPADPFTSVKVTIGTTTGVDLTIVNTQQGALSLPMTGAAGEVLLIVAGLGVGALTLGLMLVNRRRSATAKS